jgi:hypothetical protein
LTQKNEAVNTASLASGRGRWKGFILRNDRLTRESEATTSPPPPQPGEKRWGRFSGSWVFEIVDLERETQAAVS